MVSHVSNDDFDSFKIQFYAISGVLAFVVIVLIAVVINLSVKVRQLRKGEKYEDEDEEVEVKERPPPPPVNSELSFPKPNISKQWRDTDAEIRKQNDQQEFSIPKPALSKSWQAYSGERDRNQPKRNFGNDFRQDDDMSNMSFDGGRRSPTFPNPSNAFRNPYTINNNSDPNYSNNDNRPDRPPKPFGNRMPSNNGNNFNQGGGNDNFGFRRDQRNNYY